MNVWAFGSFIIIIIIIIIIFFFFLGGGRGVGGGREVECNALEILKNIFSVSVPSCEGVRPEGPLVKKNGGRGTFRRKN